MPRIAAPTLAEHRARQRSALVEAATELLVTHGAAAVTPGAVGAAVGLARSSVYQYFDSAAAILAAIIEDSFPRSNALLTAALTGIEDPLEVMAVYVRETLRQAAAGAHRPAAALAAVELPPECRARLVGLHQEQIAPLVAALDRLEVPDVTVTVRLISGMLESAMGAVGAGEPADVVTRSALRMLRGVVPADDPAPEP